LDGHALLDLGWFIVLLLLQSAAYRYVRLKNGVG
jgi:hypothetical protein